MTPTCICLKLSQFHYEKLSSYLNSFPETARPLPSVWFVNTNKDVQQIKNDIEALINANDSVFVFTKEHYAGANIDFEEAKNVRDIWL